VADNGNKEDDIFGDFFTNDGESTKTEENNLKDKLNKSGILSRAI
jgi:hypothetical protein